MNHIPIGDQRLQTDLIRHGANRSVEADAKDSDAVRTRPEASGQCSTVGIV